MVKLYENGRKFLEDTGELLSKREAVFQNILVNARAGAGRTASADFLFGSVWNAEELVLAFCNCHPWNLTIGSVLTKGADTAAHGKNLPVRPEEKKIAEAVKELAVFVKEKQLSINGIHASGLICRTFLTHYCEEKRLAKMHLSMDIMVCRRLLNCPLQEGIYRSACPQDADWLLDACLAFEWDALGTEGSREEYRKNIREHQLPENRVRLFCLPDNTPVCMVKRCREMEHGFSINQVYTLPAYREKGYAQTLVHKACEEFLTGPFTYATLYVDQKNPISNRVYRKVGFEIEEDAYDYIFTEEDVL